MKFILTGVAGVLLHWSVCGSAFAQQVPEIENGIKYEGSQVSPFLHSLYEQNDLVVSFSVSYAGRPDKGSDDYILTRKADHILAYTFDREAENLRLLDISPDSLDLVLKTFIQNDIFTMRNERDVSNFCAEKYHVYNSHTYDFTMLSSGRIKKLSYYDPEYYDQVCYGMSERQKIINCAAVISLVYLDKSGLN